MSLTVPGAGYHSQASMQKPLTYVQQQHPSVLQKLPVGWRALTEHTKVVCLPGRLSPGPACRLWQSTAGSMQPTL